MPNYLKGWNLRYLRLWRKLSLEGQYKVKRMLEVLDLLDEYMYNYAKNYNYSRIQSYQYLCYE